MVNVFEMVMQQAKAQRAIERVELTDEQFYGGEAIESTELPENCTPGAVREYLGLSDSDFFGSIFDFEEAVEAIDQQIAELEQLDIDIVGVECEGENGELFWSCPDELGLKEVESKGAGGYDRLDSLGLDAQYIINSERIEVLAERVAYWESVLAKFPGEQTAINTLDSLKRLKRELEVTGFGEGYPKEIDTTCAVKPKRIYSLPVVEKNHVVRITFLYKEPVQHPEEVKLTTSEFKTYAEFYQYVLKKLRSVKGVTKLLVTQVASELYYGRHERAVIKLAAHLVEVTKDKLPEQPSLGVDKDKWDSWVNAAEVHRAKQLMRAGHLLAN